MSVRIVDVDTSALRKRFAIMTRRSKDFRPVFRWVMQELQKAHRTNFMTKGASSGSPWSPLDPEYAAWKLEHYGAKGILVRDGTLKHSLTVDSGRGAVRDMGLRTAEFGTAITHAKFHQTGTPNMAQRKPVFVPPLMAFRTATVVGEHIMYGSLGVRYADAMKGFVV